MTVERPLRLKGIDSERAYTPKEIKALKETAQRDEAAPPVIRKIHKKGTSPTPCAGCLRPLSAARLRRRVRARRRTPRHRADPAAGGRRHRSLSAARGAAPRPDAWYDPARLKIGYEISFTRYFYKPQPLRTLEEIRADILALEGETEGLLRDHWGRYEI